MGDSIVSTRWRRCHGHVCNTTNLNGPSTCRPIRIECNRLDLVLVLPKLCEPLTIQNLQLQRTMLFRPCETDTADTCSQSQKWRGQGNRGGMWLADSIRAGRLKDYAFWTVCHHTPLSHLDFFSRLTNAGAHVNVCLTLTNM